MLSNEDRIKKAGNRPGSLKAVHRAMLRRCNNESCDNFHRYGGRGVQVCQEWYSFPLFREWAMANGFRPGLWLDRQKNDIGYQPDNCRFVTPSENNRNRPCCKLNAESVAAIKSRISSGEKLNVIAKDFGISDTLISLIKHGKRWADVVVPAELAAK